VRVVSKTTKADATRCRLIGNIIMLQARSTWIQRVQEAFFRSLTMLSAQLCTKAVYTNTPGEEGRRSMRGGYKYYHATIPVKYNQ
jgi:hypothetical protein